jgi:hypothetical protein
MRTGVAIQTSNYDRGNVTTQTRNRSSKRVEHSGCSKRVFIP